MPVKRLLSWFGGVLFGLAVLLGIAIVLITLPVGEKLIRREAEQRLGAWLQKPVHIGFFETNLLNRIVLHDVRVDRDSTDSEHPLLTLPHGRIDYTLADLLHSEIHLRDIQLDSLFIDLSRDTTGRLVIAPPPSPPTPDTTSGRWTLALGHIGLEAGKARYRDRLLPLQGGVKGVEADLVSKASDRWEFEVAFDSLRASWREYPLVLTDLAGKGWFTGRQVELDRLAFRVPGFQAEGEGGCGWGSEAAPIDARLTLKGSPEPFSRRFRNVLTSNVAPIRGNLQIDLHATGSFASPRVESEIHFPQLSFPSAEFQRGYLVASWHPGGLEIDTLHARYEDGSLALHGDVVFDSLLTHHLWASIDKINLGKAWSSIYRETSPYHGLMRGSLVSSGPLLRPRMMAFEGDLALEYVSYKNQSLPDFTAQVTSEQGVASLHIQQASSDLQMKLRFAKRQLDGDFTFRIHELEPLVDLANISELTGRLSLAGSINGTVEHPRVEARFDGGNIRFQNFPVDSILGSVEYRDGRVTLGESYAMAWPTMFDSTRPPFHIEGLKGGFSYRLRLSGSPENPTGSIFAHLVTPSYKGIGLDGAHIAASIEDTVLQVERLQLLTDSLLIRVSGEYSLPAMSGQATIRLHDVPPDRRMGEDLVSQFPSPGSDQPRDYPAVGNLQAWFDLHDLERMVFALQGDEIHVGNLLCAIPDPPDVSGMLSFQSSFEGNLRDPSGELHFTVNTPRYQNVEMDSLLGDVLVDPQHLTMKNVELYLGGHRSWASLDLGLDRGEDGYPTLSRTSSIKGESEARNIDMRLANTFLPSAIVHQGSSSYRVTVAGRLGGPRLNGDWSVSNGEFQVSPDSPVIRDVQFRASLRDSVLAVDNLQGMIREARFSLTGRLKQRQWRDYQGNYVLQMEGREVFRGQGRFNSGEINLTLHSRGLNLSMMQAFVPGVKRLQGYMQASLEVHGTMQNPKVDGNLGIHGLTVQPTGLDRAVTQGVVVLGFKGNRVSVDTLDLKLNEGFASATGTLVYSQGTISDVDLEATGKSLTFKQEDNFQATIQSADVTVKSADDNGYLVDGDVILGESRYLRRFQPRDIIALFQKSSGPKPEMSPLLKRTKLNIRIRQSDDVWVDNNLARLRLNADVAFRGTLERLNMTGRLSVQEGYVLFLDRKFHVNTGVLDFVDPNRINPIVNLSAQASLKAYQTSNHQPYTIFLVVQGPIDEATVDLTSNPPMDQTDIISLLTVGATREQLIGKGTTGSSMADILRQRAENLSSQRISGYVSRKVGTAFGLEEMSVEGNLFNISKSWGPQLLASKKLTDRMEVTYTTRVGHLNEQGIKLDYKLTKHLSVEGQTDQQGGSGLDLIYKVKFK